MPDTCGNIKAILVELQGKDLSSTAKLAAVLEVCGITDREEVEALLECKASTLREAKRALKIQRQKSSSAENPAPEIQRPAGNPARTPEFQRQNSSATACAGNTTGATNELPSEVSSYKQTDSRTREVSQSVEMPSAELKQAFNGSTENLIADIQRWMSADRHHAVKWLTTLLSIAGSDAVLAAYGQLLESQTKGKLIADPIRYLGKTAPTLKGKQPVAEPAPLMIDGKPFKVTGVRYAKPRDEVANA